MQQTTVKNNEKEQITKMETWDWDMWFSGKKYSRIECMTNNKKVDV